MMAANVWMASERIDGEQPGGFPWQPILVYGDSAYLCCSIDHYFSTAEACEEWIEHNLVGATFDLG